MKTCLDKEAKNTVVGDWTIVEEKVEKAFMAQCYVMERQPLTPDATPKISSWNRNHNSTALLPFGEIIKEHT
jgi:hypothetical protein